MSERGGGQTEGMVEGGGGGGDEREQWISFKAYTIHYCTEKERERERERRREIAMPTYK